MTPWLTDGRSRTDAARVIRVPGCDHGQDTDDPGTRITEIRTRDEALAAIDRALMQWTAKTGSTLAQAMAAAAGVHAAAEAETSRRAQRVDVCVPKTSSTLCDQAVFVDKTTGVSLPSDAVPVEIHRFG